MYVVLLLLLIQTKDVLFAKWNIERRYKETQSERDGAALEKCKAHLENNLIGVGGLGLMCLAVPFSAEFFVNAFKL